MQKAGNKANGEGFQAGAITQSLNETGLEPQELDLLGSVCGNYCLFFNYF